MGESRCDLVIVGGGIVGLATALALLERRPELRLAVLEKEPRLAAHQSGHNSGVIHSGIYYKPGSLKAETCVEGATAMLEFCRAHGIPHKVCGKVVVATSQEEVPALEELRRRGEANGVPGLRMLAVEELRAIEPHAAGVRALQVPGTAITDYAAVCEKYAELLRAAGGEVRTGARVTGIVRRGGETVVETSAGEVRARFLVNCAGLHSDRIARLAGAEPGVRIVPFRGEYYELRPAAQALVRGLIYPVPDPKFPFLGVHLTPRVRGGVEAGPNAVLALKREGYGKLSFSPRDAATTLFYGGFWRLAGRYWRSGAGEMARSFLKGRFVRALQKLVPELRREDLAGGGAGVRAQAVDARGALVDDFRMVRGEGAIHVLNVPSPAATASLAIGKRIAQMMEEALRS
ncbi:MAG TPA: L-2-hydroxyglutarate oxidase [Terriglobales bacterium]|nr:L-2-hydroxyglutarate oxidase [Terriglobales bacterium]